MSEYAARIDRIVMQYTLAPLLSTLVECCDEMSQPDHEPITRGFIEAVIVEIRRERADTRWLLQCIGALP